MKTKMVSSMFLAAAAAAWILAAAPVQAAEGPSPEAVEGASTAADHNAIADAYDAQAKEFRQSAAHHERLGNTYGKGPAYRKNPSGGARANAMSGHCEKLTQSFNAAAAQADALAKAHRDLAAQAK